jgi:hypothetical protein
MLFPLFSFAPTHKFVLSFLGASTAASWLRDLVKEGVEPNPGPTWEELVAKISEMFPKKEAQDQLMMRMSLLLPKLKTHFPGEEAITTQMVIDYLDNLKKDALEDLLKATQLTTYNLQSIREAIQKISGTAPTALD